MMIQPDFQDQDACDDPIKAAFLRCFQSGSSQARASILREIEAESPDVGQQVRLLLEQVDLPLAVDDLVQDRLADQSLNSRLAPWLTENNRSKIGHYELREQLGEGGMGIVFVAEQQQPVRREVALKIIRAGMSSKEILARFEAERQALAIMDHPCIARVLDGGTTPNGQPYFVMELVRGVPITKYADSQQLGIRQRLELFTTVCRAVQHAHRKGVIHRDLKPSNIMVTEIDGQPTAKVIDFGLAKAIGQPLTEATIDTGYSRMLGTPMYMSPEQASLGEIDIDTRSDVYSLGVLLYELLTGSTPFDRETLKSAGFEEVRRIIREVEPQRPSYAVSTLAMEKRSTVAGERRMDSRRLHDTLRGELDWIVLKALEKERGRRYESASALADDIERYLNGEPVDAGPTSTAYRLRKYAYRHRALLATTGLILLTAFIGAAVSLSYARKASISAANAGVAKSTAERKAVEAQRANERSQEMLYVADMKLASDAVAAGDIPRARELVERHVPGSGEIDHRGFEWNLLRKRIEIPPSRTLSLGGYVDDVEVSSDGKWLAAVGPLGQVEIFAMGSNEKRLSLATRTEAIYGLSWSSDGKLLAAACANGEINLWSFPDGQSLRIIPAHQGRTLDVVFSPDGQYLYSSGEDNLAKCWSVEAGDLQRSFEGHQRAVEQIAISHDGKRLATASSDETLALWDAESAERQRVFDFDQGRVVSVAISNNGRFVAAGDIDGYLNVIEIKSGRRLTNEKLVDGIESVAFMRNDRWLVTADRGGAIQLHDVPRMLTPRLRTATDRLPRWVAHQGRALAIAATPDGQQIISGGRDGEVRIWRPDLAATGWELYRDPDHNDLAMAANNRLLVAGRCVHVWDLDQRRVIESFLPADPAWKLVVCSPDGQHMAAARQGQLVLVDLETKQIVDDWQLDPRVDPHRIAISPDGEYVAITDFTDRETVDLYQRGEATSVRSIPARQCECLVFSPDGRTLAVGSLDDLKLIDLQEQRHDIVLNGHSSTLASADFHPEGRWIATVSSDRLLKLWNVETGEEIDTIVAHADDVSAVAFSPDGRTMATVGHDHQIKLWHTATRQPLGGWSLGPDRAVKAMFGSDGIRLATVNRALRGDRLIIYDASPSLSANQNSATPATSSNPSTFSAIDGLPTISAEIAAGRVSPNGMHVIVHRSVDGKSRLVHWSREQGIDLSGPELSPARVGGLADNGDFALGLADQKTNPRTAARLTSDASDFQAIAEKTSIASGISADGKVIVGSFFADDRWQAFRWQEGEKTTLPNSAEHQHCEACAITPTGEIILGRVYNLLPGRGKHHGRMVDVRPVLWKAGELHQLDGFDPQRKWWPFDLSDDGGVIVGVRYRSTDEQESRDLGGHQAFRWHNGKTELLGTLSGFENSWAHAVSGDGRLVIGISGPGRDGHPGLGIAWTKERGLHSLAEHLSARGTNLSGWTILAGQSLSSDATTIVGAALTPAGRRASWVVTMPEATR